MIMFTAELFANVKLEQEVNMTRHDSTRPTIPVCVQKKRLSAHVQDPEKAEALYGRIGKVLNPDWGQRGRF